MAEKPWHDGYRVDRFEFEGHLARVVHPKEGTTLGRLGFKTEYWNAFPYGMQVPLLEKGFHLCFVEKSNRWGTEDMLALQERFMTYVTETYGLSLYLDNPVLNYLSCPCGFGKAQVLDDGDAIPEILNALGYESISQLICCRDMPMDHLPKLIEHKIPAVLVAGLKDDIAPYEENGILLQQAYEKAGLDLLLCLKPEDGHHPHGLDDPKAAVEFILNHE